MLAIVVVSIVPLALAVDFEREVAPILEAKCMACHDAEHRKGGLSLATRADALRGGRSGDAAIVTNDPNASALIVAVEPDGDDEPSMPKGKPPLPASDVEVLRRWIDEGATWPEGRVLVDRSAQFEFEKRRDWWSLKPIAKTVPPSDAANPIDAFIAKALSENGLEPTPLADRRTLIRRVTYDLTGLPPTPEEIDAFLADAAPDAYERLVDRLLASPRSGERFARAWLDIVHYGETHGYDKDKPRENAWPYRDYVIASFHTDKPYAQFVAEQIAGDALFPGNPDALVATGFIAAGPWDFVGHVELREGTTDKAITRNLDRDDMVMNAMSTFASATVHCARCHDHKFDAITQQDYYSLQAVFAGVERADRLFDADPQIGERRRQLLAERADLDRPSDVASKHLGYHSEIFAAADTPQEVVLDLGGSLPIDRVVLVPAHEVYGGWPGPGFGFPVRLDVALAESRDFADARVVVDHTRADLPNPGDTPFVIECDGRPARFVRVRATSLWKRTGDYAFALGELVVESGGVDRARNATVTASSSIEAAPRWALANLTDGVTFSGTLPSDRGAIARWLEGVRERERIERELEALPSPRKVFAAASSFDPVGAFTPPPGPRPIHVLARGDVNQPREEAQPGALRAVQELPSTFVSDAERVSSDEGKRRAALAAWLTDSRNPLVWRSIVNRVWQWHFGRGIVDTASDFGHLGALPSHPELLDFLATWFLEHDGSLKQLHRLIVTSETYRRASFASDAARGKDAENRLLSHAPRLRLDAEQIRDALLSISGRLDPRMGGPSDRQFGFKDDHSPVYDYEAFDVDSTLGQRRSIYRFLVRSVPDPLMECLDCPDASLLTPKRNVTITALQALAMLNDPFVLAQCRHLADRVLRESSGDLDRAIGRAFLLALGREPDSEELAAFAAHARQFGLPAACRVLVNLDEFLFID